jgi:hypothetical protein
MIESWTIVFLFARENQRSVFGSHTTRLREQLRLYF